MFCGECGAPNPDTNQFCRNCGKPLGRRQPAGHPAVQPVPVPACPVSQPVTPASAVPGQSPATAPVPVSVPAPKRTGNLLGIVSLILGLLSWGILTVILAILAVLLGIASLFLFRKATGRIGISSIIGIILGIAAIIVTLVLV